MNGFIKSCALVLAACLLAGCASAPDLPPQPTLDELLAETNAAHQAVTKPQVDASQYMTRPAPDEETVDYFTGGEQTAFDPDAVVTAAQAAEDMEYLFDAFRTLYGPYDFFGGDETFGRHKAELQARLEEKESWTAAEVQDLLLEGLRFFEDGHFAVNGQRPNPWKVPFFFRESAFYRMEGGYIREDGKRVASVDGYEDLDELFKRSISPEGEIVYYPILLEEDGLQAGDVTLTIHYTDGSAQTLTAVRAVQGADRRGCHYQIPQGRRDPGIYDRFQLQWRYGRDRSRRHHGCEISGRDRGSAGQSGRLG